ncbi:tyrosine-protein phosphatase non-receptor type, putative [Pediculus humanus corporis]|uniref:protein-tyrosine-phosphatase n=1 Tax=Pediculus humanus subsp. corporis TaxID=121224 RepID=E0W220_PEDHC|nr:tyrosine-protein phosphatase non-receptor type, putative [Pediculus humanus corporis]EEB19614.1 tyrosine-protein phosphatase non-receptor type, putative [Pediculus humanus corporis]
MSDIVTSIMSDVENEFLSIEKGQGWNSFFSAIRDECLQAHNYAFTEAKKPKNKYLNRYRDVYPYDHSRIVLSKNSIDYINANLVVVEGANRKYILTQGPLPQTTSHFWLMIWEQNCQAIVMLNRIMEKNVVKCHQYWPQSDSTGEEKSLILDDVNLKVINVSEEKDPCYITTNLILEDLETGNQREVIHFHCTTWPDFGVPQSPTAFLRFLNAVRASGALEQEGPAVVHCSAGIGRSGTFCLVDSCLVMIQDMKLNNVVVKDVLMEMRKYRMGLVQTPGQLRFSYLAIIKGLDKTELENGWPKLEEVKDEENSEDEEAPPLPPPRNESLSASRECAETSKGDKSSGQDNDIVEKTMHRQAKYQGGRSSTGTRKHPYKTGNRYLHRKHRDRSRGEEESTTLHQRKGRDVRNQILENKIKEVKKKLRETESWQKWRKSLFHPWSIGCLIIGSGIVVCALLAFRD